ncbi:UvrD-helicase domain-containing protein [Streptomyces olivaceiscleroticus]|uniref:UvrD-helicase domain-containing protein n=1 Tax=Streptomyces olivaceiscleroticus TaxID=68245 RepID=A0ABN1AVG9_9ACTN
MSDQLRTLTTPTRALIASSAAGPTPSPGTPRNRSRPPDAQPDRGSGGVTRHSPTDEQLAAADAFHAGDHLVIQAGAGTGKTTTLAMLARSTRRPGRYLAFNKAIAQDAARRFPAHVTCSTAHSLAYAAVGHRFRRRMSAPRQAGWRTGAALGIDAGFRLSLGSRTVTSKALSCTVLGTVTNFCRSADPTLTAAHVPRLRGAEADAQHDQLAEIALPYARKAWADLQKPDRGAVRFEHDHYLKMWALSAPLIETDFLLLDEAQDTNPVVEQVFNAQRAHAQLVLVGDSAQAIYGWRGARDVMTGFRGRQLTLSRSFRFGPVLAVEANRWLAIVDAPVRLTGSRLLDTDLGPVPRPDAVLCRSNAGAMAEVMRLLSDGRRVALAGGDETLTALARAAHDLQGGRRTNHPELMLFESWEELREYATSDPSGRDLLPLVELLDEHSAENVLRALRCLSSEKTAETTVSTAHRAKGREWPSVRIAADFTEPDELEDTDENGERLPGPIDLAEARLAYVAVTRARRRLDLGGLSWINSHPAGDIGAAASERWRRSGGAGARTERRGANTEGSDPPPVPSSLASCPQAEAAT